MSVNRPTKINMHPQPIHHAYMSASSHLTMRYSCAAFLGSQGAAASPASPAHDVPLTTSLHHLAVDLRRRL